MKKRRRSKRLWDLVYKRGVSAAVVAVGMSHLGCRDLEPHVWEKAM
jgi:hypothetical protein